MIAVTLGVLGSLMWGAHSSVSVFGLRTGLDSFDIAAARVVGAAFAVIPFLLVRGLSILPPVKQTLWLTLGAGVPFGLLNVVGLQFSPHVHCWFRYRYKSLFLSSNNDNCGSYWN